MAAAWVNISIIFKDLNLAEYDARYFICMSSCILIDFFVLQAKELNSIKSLSTKFIKYKTYKTNIREIQGYIRQGLGLEVNKQIKCLIYAIVYG